MGIASFSPFFSLSKFGAFNTPMMFAPVQALVSLFMPVQPTRCSQRSAVQPTAQRPSNAQTMTVQVLTTRPKAPVGRPVSCLKVIREVEPGMRRSQTGRMAISGRMADVCAELERISLKECSK